MSVGAAEEVRGGLRESGAMGANDELLGGEVVGAEVSYQLGCVSWLEKDGVRGLGVEGELRKGTNR